MVEGRVGSHLTGNVADLMSTPPTSVGATLTADAMRVSSHLGLVSTDYLDASAGIELAAGIVLDGVA